MWFESYYSALKSVVMDKTLKEVDDGVEPKTQDADAAKDPGSVSQTPDDSQDSQNGGDT